MLNRDDTRERSASGVPIGATDAELAAAQEAVATTYNAWADGVTVPVGASFVNDGNVWPEAVVDGGPDPATTGKVVRRAVADAG